MKCKIWSKQLTVVTLMVIAVSFVQSCQNKTVQTQADVYGVLWSKSFINFGTQIIGFDVAKMEQVSEVSVADKIGEVTKDKNYLWLSAPAGKNERFGKNVYRYNFQSMLLEKVIEVKGFAPNKIFLVNDLVFVSMYISDIDIRPFNSSIEVYKINRDNDLSFVKSIYLDKGTRFKADLISTSPSKDYLYIASWDLYNADTGEAPVLYVINTKTLEIESKLNLVEYFGASGGIAVNSDDVFISVLQKYPGAPGKDAIEKIKDNRILVFDRRKLKLKNEIILSNHFPEQLIYNKARNHLYVLHNFRSTMAISIVDCSLQREIGVIDGIGDLSDMALADSNTLFVTSENDGKKRLISIDLNTHKIIKEFIGSYGALSYQN